MRRRDGGFTLLEVLVALAILSTTLVLAYRGIAEALAAQERADRWTEAAYLGEELLREAASGFPETGDTEGRFPPPREGFTWRRSVRQALHADAREIHVTVAWTTRAREETLLLSGLAVR